MFIGKLLCESEKSYILKTDLMSSNVGCSPGQMRKQNFGDSLSRDRSNESKRLNTLPNAQFEYTYFRRQLNMLENEIYQNYIIYSNVFNNSSKHDYNNLLLRNSFQTSKPDKSKWSRRKDDYEGNLKDLPVTK